MGDEAAVAREAQSPCRASARRSAIDQSIVATLEAVAPVTGSARVVGSAPKLALALGYDVEAALEQFDP